MGQATSRTKPSIVACEALARSPAMEVLCGEWDAARTETIQQPASKQTLRNRLIGSPFHRALHTLQPASSRCRILQSRLVNWRNIAITLIDSGPKGFECKRPISTVPA